MSIGTNIYTLRKDKKLTQAQLAEKLGVSEQAVSKWENCQCAPDVSLFPIIAEFFGVSIDRIFGYHKSGYAEEVKAIIKAADDSLDTYKEIEIVSEGLKKYPNSPELKIYLAFSLSMINRISKNESERKEAINKAIKLCTEVIDACGDTKQVDEALVMLIRIYTETGCFQKAEDAIAKLSSDSFDARITGTVKMLGIKKCFAEQEEYAEASLWKLYYTMNRIFENITGSLTANKDYEKAIAFFDAHEKLLSIFDRGCSDFCAAYKTVACENKAKTYMKMGNKEKCLEELKHFLQLAEQVKRVADQPDLNIAARNPLYFSGITDEIGEEYMSSIYPEKALRKYDAFFVDDESYVQLKSFLNK